MSFIYSPSAQVEEKSKELILVWCRKQKKPTEMRQFGLYMTVCLLGTAKNVYKNVDMGLPTNFNEFNPEVVLAHGQSWTEVANLLGLQKICRCGEPTDSPSSEECSACYRYNITGE